MYQLVHLNLFRVKCMQTGPIDDKESKCLIDAFSMRYQWIADTHEHCIATCCIMCTSVQWQWECERKLHYTIISCVTIGPDIHTSLPLISFVLNVHVLRCTTLLEILEYMRPKVLSLAKIIH